VFNTVLKIGDLNVLLKNTSLLQTVVDISYSTDNVQKNIYPYININLYMRLFALFSKKFMFFNLFSYFYNHLLKNNV